MKTNTHIHHDLILFEGAINEQIRRNPRVELHPILGNAPLIYTESGQKALQEIYSGYLQIARSAELPFYMCTPTWRADKDRISISAANPKINQDAVKFLKRLRDSASGDCSQTIKIGGLIGCKNDCYRPDHALDTSTAYEYHRWQVNELATASPDFLIAQTLPQLAESIGIATAMAKTKLPYYISFVINRHGTILDGTTLCEAIETIDAVTNRPPAAYFVNCAYPTFFRPEMLGATPLERLKGFLANASSLDHDELDGADSLKVDSISDWGTNMLKLYHNHRVHMLGGCCGTGNSHLQYLVDHYRKSI